MKRGRNRVTQANRASTGDPLGHLADAIHSNWRRYSKRFKRCQKHFSEEAVHDSRVQARRLLSQVRLLAGFIPVCDLKKARRPLREHLDTFDRLRDTHVQLACVGQMTDKFPAAVDFAGWLRRRESRFERETRVAIKRIKFKRLGQRLAGFEKELRGNSGRMAPARALRTMRDSIGKAHARVVQLSQRVSASDLATVHRTRIAFKQFVHKAEALAPLLPGITARRIHAMRKLLGKMGAIQDVEVLMAALAKFEGKGTADAGSIRELRAELLRRREALVQDFIKAKDGLSRFWPLP